MGHSVTFFVTVLKIYWPWCSHDRRALGNCSLQEKVLPVYNIHVKLGVVCCKKRGEHAIGFAHASQIPGMLIHAALKSAQAVETKAVKPLKGENYTQRCDILEVLKWGLTIRIENSINTPIRLALIEQEAVRCVLKRSNCSIL